MDYWRLIQYKNAILPVAVYVSSTLVTMLENQSNQFKPVIPYAEIIQSYDYVTFAGGWVGVLLW